MSFFHTPPLHKRVGLKYTRMSDSAAKSEWVGPAMLNPKLKLLLTNYAGVVNPTDQKYGGNFDTPLLAYKKHATFLDACGHGTSELTAAIGGVEAAVVALQEANSRAAQRFEQDPFPANAVTSVPLEGFDYTSRNDDAHDDPRKHSV
jgi:hypothetical protein